MELHCDNVAAYVECLDTTLVIMYAYVSSILTRAKWFRGKRITSTWGPFLCLEVWPMWFPAVVYAALSISCRLSHAMRPAGRPIRCGGVCTM